MKFIIDPIEDIRTEIGNEPDFTLHAMLLKEDVADPDKLIYGGCKKRTKPATHRVCIRPVKTLDIRPPIAVMIRPLLLKERDFIFA